MKIDNFIIIFTIREEDIAIFPTGLKAIVYQIYPDSFASSKRYILGEKRDGLMGKFIRLSMVEQ